MRACQTGAGTHSHQAAGRRDGCAGRAMCDEGLRERARRGAAFTTFSSLVAPWTVLRRRALARRRRAQWRPRANESSSETKPSSKPARPPATVVDDGRRDRRNLGASATVGTHDNILSRETERARGGGDGEVAGGSREGGRKRQRASCARSTGGGGGIAASLAVVAPAGDLHADAAGNLWGGRDWRRRCCRSCEIWLENPRSFGRRRGYRKRAVAARTHVADALRPDVLVELDVHAHVRGLHDLVGELLHLWERGRGEGRAW